MQNTANAIYVKDGDVYVTGTYGSAAKYDAVYWKNGTRITLQKSDSASSYGQGIFVK